MIVKRPTTKQTGATAGLPSSVKRAPGAHCWTSQPWHSARKPSNNGTSLVEVCAVMAANAVLMGVATAALVAVGRADVGLSRQANERTALPQMMDRLRRDIHSAVHVRWDAAEQTLRLSLANNHTLTYRRDRGAWTRRSLDPGGTADAEGELTAAFRLAGDLQPKFEPSEAIAGELVRIVWTPVPDGPLPDRATDAAPEIVVAVGRDERMLQQ